MPDIQNLPDIFNSVINPPLWIVTSRSGEVRGGLVATLVANASLVPELPRMVVGIAKQHNTWTVIESANVFALHLLKVTDVDLIEKFGLRTGKVEDKFSDIIVEEGETGSPLLKRGLLFLDCVVESSMDIGDRTIYVAKVVDSQILSDGKPLRLQDALSSLSDVSRNSLRRLLHRDVAVDRSAILDWRASRADQGAP